MPSVNPGESQKKFVSRCIPIVLNEGTTKDQKQAAAICFSLYSEHQKKKKSKARLIKGLADNYLEKNKQ